MLCGLHILIQPLGTGFEVLHGGADVGGKRGVMQQLAKRTLSVTDPVGDIRQVGRDNGRIISGSFQAGHDRVRFDRYERRDECSLLQSRGLSD